MFCKINIIPGRLFCKNTENTLKWEKKHNLPHHHHQNSIRICLHHSAISCILLFLYHAAQYPQTREQEQISEQISM